MANGKELSQRTLYSGYPGVCIRQGGKKLKRYVHVLVALAHIPNPEGKPFVNHKDGKKINMRADNLEWVTHRENMEHAVKAGLLNPSRGKLSDNDVLEIRRANVLGSSVHELAREFGVDPMTIHYAVTGKTWKEVGGPIRPSGARAGARGERNPKAKIRSDQARSLREKFRSGATVRDLAEEYSLGICYVYSILHGDRWSEAGGPIFTDIANRIEA